MKNPFKTGRLITDRLIARAASVVFVCILILVPLLIASARMRGEGNRYLESVMASFGPLLEYSPETLAKDASDLKSLSARVGLIPSKPKCATEQAVAFLVATRKQKFAKEASWLADEHSKALDQYSNEVRMLSRKKADIDLLIRKLIDHNVRYKKQNPESYRLLHDEATSFRKACSRCIIFWPEYRIRYNSLVKAVEKAKRDSATDSFSGEFVTLHREREHLIAEVTQILGIIGASERAAQRAEEKLRKIPFTSSNVEKLWAEQVSAGSNSIAVKSAALLRELSTDRESIMQVLNAADRAIQQYNKESELLQGKFPGCLNASDATAKDLYQSEVEATRKRVDQEMTAATNNINSCVEKYTDRVNAMNSKASKLLRKTVCDEAEWMALFDDLGGNAAEAVDFGKTSIKALSGEINKLIDSISKETKNMSVRTRENWESRMKDLYNERLRSHNEAVDAVSVALRSIEPTKVGARYKELSQQLEAIRDMCVTVLEELYSLKKSIPKDASTLSAYKTKLDSVAKGDQRAVELLNEWKTKYDEAVATAKPHIRLEATLNGIGKQASVVKGVNRSGLSTPVPDITSEVGVRISFGVELVEDGVKYVGEKDYIVKAGAQTVTVALRPEFTLPSYIRFCGDCGKSLGNHRNVRRCPYCSAYLLK